MGDYIYEIPIYSWDEEISLERDFALVQPQGFYLFLWYDHISQNPAPVDCGKSVYITMRGLGMEFLILSGDISLYLQLHAESSFPEPENRLCFFFVYVTVQVHLDSGHCEYFTTLNPSF